MTLGRHGHLALICSGRLLGTKFRCIFRNVNPAAATLDSAAFEAMALRALVLVLACLFGGLQALEDHIDAVAEQVGSENKRDSGLSG